MRALPVVLLAPSEDKATGGVRGRLSETPAQRWVRERLAALAQSGDAEALGRAFGVKGIALDRARSEALALGGAVPLLPALARYTGVAFQALAADSLPRAVWSRVFILSALRGLVRGDDPVPPYKLKLAAVPGLKVHWHGALPPALSALPEGEVWELLPADAAGLLRGWHRPRHTVDIVDVHGRALSHFSKLYRGRVARWILEHGQGEPRRVLRGRIPGCRWVGASENDLGGMTLRLELEP